MAFIDGTQAPAGSSVEEEQEEVEQDPQGQPTEDPNEEGGELANPFLENIPEEDREVVARYAKQWDAGVTRRFQELHNGYKPYKDLGPVEELQKAVEIAKYIRENPEELYGMLHEQYGTRGGGQQQTQPQPQTTPSIVPGTQNTSLAELPEELQPLAQLLQSQEQQYATKFQTYEEQNQKLEKTLNIVAEYVVKQLETDAQRREDQELEDYMTNLHTEFGDFDDQYVLTKISAGVPADKAVRDYKAAVQAEVNRTRKADPSVPAVLSGGGGTPSTARKPAEMSPEETRDFVASVLAKVNEQ